MKTKCILFLLICLILNACKSKQVIQQSTKVSSEELAVDSVQIQYEDEMFIAYLPPGNIQDSIDTSILSKNNLTNIVNRYLPKVKLPNFITKSGYFIIHAKKTSKEEKHLVLEKENEKGNTQYIKEDNKNNVCHYGGYLLFFIFFICLVVTIRKKIAEKFGSI